ncbi:MAG: DNA adenine methylase [Candidatus Pacebacteria bacterium]|nr:DNA adenine methylase [Candidatus Paceibacterota bacterium]
MVSPTAGFSSLTVAKPTSLAIQRSPAILEDKNYLSSQIITYIGNKRALLSEISTAFELVCRELGRDKLVFLDLFSGTGVVSRLAKQYSRHIIANDLETYSTITNSCYLSNGNRELELLLKSTLIDLQKTIETSLKPGFITELYAAKDESRINSRDRVFYTRQNAIFIDSACRAIAQLPDELQVYFTAPLLAQASVHVNTAGVFKGFYKNQQGIGQFGGSGSHALCRILKPIELHLPVLSRFPSSHEVTQMEAGQLVKQLDDLDLAYFDPPYNQHPYGSNYFMLNLIADYQRPQTISAVSGIPADWNRSDYNRRAKAAAVLFDSIANCPARFILVSYNSEGFISLQEFRKTLSKLGRLHYMDRQYNTYRGCRNLAARAKHLSEYLFLLDRR